MPLSPRSIGLRLALCLLLAGCSQSGPAPDPEHPHAGQTLNVINWSDYLNPDLIPEFERRTGAHVQYDNFSTDSELETKVVVGGGGYDVIFPSDRSLVPLIRKNRLAELDRSMLPNWKHLDPLFLGGPWDPSNRFSVPYFWGLLAVGIRTDRVQDPVQDFSILFDERYRGRITMLDDAENCLAAALLYLHYPIDSTRPGQLAEARNLLRRQYPLLQAYTSDGYKEKLIRGDAWIALGWSGDILQAQRENPHIAVVLPPEGTMKWVDSMAIPRDAANPALAHEFINFLLEPEVAARNARFVAYPTPNRAARGLLEGELLDEAALYPPRPLIERCQWQKDRGPAVRAVETIWEEVRR